ncbi:bifunctional glycosyltransferase family 2/GtrA family protein [Luteipulveratus flavus]|uniref:dolichyl-phosphate beta-glucosyltransferase n=1 Tax=Luteipulveratus flavus TaxID=3031728 RepID=A0ABT6C701_9MICO|nr:bifunctional glycosyltransferase family 2/GtrA family protein [Luteipulveratus sp. YIM 133296]MDF8264550.1 bifunctional glycosyltransferase family 2/GtrA family protein [Luteipulveratus sp. YIM 133296]
MTTLQSPTAPVPAGAVRPTAVLDVVVPVYNEEHVLAASITRLHTYLVEHLVYPFRITVADNASTDGTLAVAHRLQDALPEVAVVVLPEKGRGRALRQVWLASDAPVLAYMDVDLSTDLAALGPLIAPLLSGHSDLAIGSRIAHGANVVRGTQREVISRCYNRVLRLGLGARFSDAQCGFKAIRRDVAQELLPLVEDDTWFFDTELLVLAQRCGLRIHEVPVDWYDDPDSRVDVLRTAKDDLRGVLRVRRALRSGALPVDDIAGRLGRGSVVLDGPDGPVVQVARSGSPLGGQLARFAVVGVLSTVLHLGLFALLATGGIERQAANLLALLVATVLNTAANRSWTFGVRGRSRALVQHGQALLIFAITWSTTALALAVLNAVTDGAGTGVATTVVAVANLVATAVRFAAMRRWIFRERPAL